MSKKQLEEQLKKLEECLERSLTGYADAIETAYKYGALDAFSDNLANPPAVLWARSKPKKELEREIEG